MFMIARVSYFCYQVRRAEYGAFMNRSVWRPHRAFKSPVSAPLGYLPPRQAGDHVALSCHGNINANVAETPARPGDRNYVYYHVLRISCER